MKPRKIDELRKQFKDEWLLIEVTDIDASTGAPCKGTLLNHSKSVDELWKEAEKHRKPVMVIYSGDWPEDLAACFIINSFTAPFDACTRINRHQHAQSV